MGALSQYWSQYWRPLERMTRQPGAAQEEALRRLLSANRDTRFGIEHGFAEIQNAAEFQQRVPVQDYEKLRPYIDDQRHSGALALTTETPLFYSQTSGSTGKPKYIPITPRTLEMHRVEQALFSFLQFRACPRAFMGAGKGLGIMGAAIEGRLDSGQEVGSVSGHLYQSMPPEVRKRFVIPSEVWSIADYNLKYLVIARLALAEPNITYLGSPNPSSFLRLLDVLNEQRETLHDSLVSGYLPALDALDSPLRENLAQLLTPAVASAKQLLGGPALTYASLWPGIRLITTWTGGSCGIALETLRGKLPRHTKVMEMGYRSTECCGTIALHAGTQSGLPPLNHHFFEFVEQARWDGGNPEFLTLDRLEANRRYYVLITTASGLYRYFMNDLVEMTGFFHRTPLLRFLQKGSGVTSLTGEKLYEAQAIEAVQAAAARHGLSASFFLLVADEEVSAYRLLIEADGSGDARAIAADVDDRLGQLNMEYHGKRASGRLGPLTVVWLRSGTAEAYKSAAIRAGQREGQFKPAVLQYRKNLTLSYESHMSS
jgi:hypothetical protein